MSYFDPQSMAERADTPRFVLEQEGDGRRWFVILTGPDGRTELVSSFASEAEARQWPSKNSK